MRILVTGASGLLGLNLALEAAQEHTVFGVVHSHPLSADAFTVIEGDLLIPGIAEHILDQIQPDWVIHCAALADLEACEADPARAYKTNSEFPGKLAALVARGGARLLHVSTDAVFDGRSGNYTEDDLPNPIGVYARTKLEGEQAVASASPDAIIARVNLYGWSLTGKRSLAEHFFYTLNAGNQVKGWTDVFFCPLLANDLSHIFLQMLQAGLAGLYHVVSSECLSKYAFGVTIARKFGLDENLIQPISVHEAGMGAVRSQNLTLQTQKLTRDLGTPPPGIAPAIEHFYRLYEQDYPIRLKNLAQAATLR